MSLSSVAASSVAATFVGFDVFEDEVGAVEGEAVEGEAVEGEAVLFCSAFAAVAVFLAGDFFGMVMLSWLGLLS